MNVVEAYIKFNKKLLIFISGLSPGSGKVRFQKILIVILKLIILIKRL